MLGNNAFYETKLKQYIEENEIPAEHLVFERSCHSVAEAAETAGVTREDFIKSVCMMAADGRLVVGIVKGEDRASTTRVAKVLGVETVRIANEEEMLERTGYPCGGTPAFGYPAQFLIDERVLRKEVVYSGGGSETALVKMRSVDLSKANGGRIVRIRS